MPSEEEIGKLVRFPAEQIEPPAIADETIMAGKIISKSYEDLLHCNQGYNPRTAAMQVCCGLNIGSNGEASEIFELAKLSVAQISIQNDGMSATLYSDFLEYFENATSVYLITVYKYLLDHGYSTGMARSKLEQVVFNTIEHLDKIILPFSPEQ